ncbi:MAG: glycerophosphodiester phosphodiesterase [Limosilactobacillus sp.]|nr:glycerophosphodiester phosphodiesterase [Limosilactobacillus sp.]
MVAVDLVLRFVILPIFFFVNTWILQGMEIPFVSLRNTGIIITTHPLLCLALLAEIVAGMFFMYYLMVLIMDGMLSMWLMTKFSFVSVWHNFKQITVGKMLLVMMYWMLVLPFNTLLFRTPLFNEIQLPQFMADFLPRKPWILVITVVAYLLMAYFGFRFLFALDSFGSESLKDSIKRSWALTKFGSGEMTNLIITLIFASLTAVVFDAVVVGIQCLADAGMPSHALGFYFFDQVLLHVGSELLYIFVLSTILNLFFYSRIIMSYFFMPEVERMRRCGKWATVLAVLALVVVSVAGTGMQTVANRNVHTVTVSHRGVADKNGVQNTIAALEKTHRLHPDYVEIDLHETKDHQFVVMHDENLKKLTGVDKRPGQLTLAQLTALTAHENGHSAKIASFDDYLKVADRLHQKLIVEIKTTPTDSADMLQRFDRHYAQTLIARHDRIHTLDYGVVQRLRKLDPRLNVMYIQPYNFAYPNHAASGYTMEYSTLTDDFITRSHMQGKDVFAWTVEKPGVMNQLVDKHVDGIVTDNLVELNRALTYHNSYAKQLLDSIMVIPL